MGISFEHSVSEGSRVRLRRLYEYRSVAYLVERPTLETQAEQYWDTALKVVKRGCKRCFGVCGPKASCIGAKEGCTGAVVQKTLRRPLLAGKNKGSSTMQSETRIERHPRWTAKRVKTHNLSQDVAPKPPCPIHEFHAAIVDFLGDFRDARQCRKM